MYNVIATMKKFEGKPVQPFWIAKTYKSLTRAKEFVASQQFNAKYNFKIEKKEITASPVSFPREC
jgi:hypothetical protein